MSTPNPVPEAPPRPGLIAVQMFLFILLGQVAGTAVGVLFYATVIGPGRVDSSWVVNVATGVVAGLVLGLLVRPLRDHWVGQLGVSAAVGAASLVILLIAGRSRGGVTSAVDIAAVILGLVVTVVLQSAVAAGIWQLKLRRQAARDL